MYLHIRPLQRDESDLLDVLMAGMSPRSRYLRFHNPVPALSPALRKMLLDVDEHDHIALVAQTRDGIPVGIVRMKRTDTVSRAAELGLAIVDDWQRRGVGRQLVDAIVARARIAGVRRLTARILPENAPALALFRAVFPIRLAHYDDGGIVLTAVLGDGRAITPNDITSGMAG
jgi:RimJ/RimL family protein N-acetyltransferase